MARKSSIENDQLTDTVYYILLCLLQPGHGYALMDKIQGLTGGALEVGPASMYTTLKKLLDAGYIALLPGEGKVYSITETGRAALLREYDRRRRIVLQSEELLKEANLHG